MPQLTIYHQHIGRPCRMPNRSGIVVDIVMINHEAHCAIHDRFEEAKPSPFHNRKYVCSVIHRVDDVEFVD